MATHRSEAEPGRRSGRLAPRAAAFWWLALRAVVGLGWLAAAPAVGAEGEGSTTWRAEWSNDEFVQSDNQFTNGFTVQRFSRRFRSLEATSGTVATGKPLARLFLPEDDTLWYREGWTAGQNIQTPEQTERSDLITNDLPYMGMIGWQSSYYAYDDERFTGFQWGVGWVGEEALGEEVQKAAHEVSNAAALNGWDNQLEGEPVANLFYSKKRKLLRLPYFDTAATADAALGNFFSFGQIGLETRFGDMPKGFAYLPDPLGRGMDYDARLDTDGGPYLYGSVTMRGTGFLNSLRLQGNTFRNDNPWTQQNTIDMERLVGQAILGGHYEARRWGLHVVLWLSSDTVDPQTVPPEQDAQNSFGAAMFEWQF